MRVVVEVGMEEDMKSKIKDEVQNEESEERDPEAGIRQEYIIFPPFSVFWIQVYFFLIGKYQVYIT